MKNLTSFLLIVAFLSVNPTSAYCGKDDNVECTESTPLKKKEVVLEEDPKELVIENVNQYYAGQIQQKCGVGDVLQRTALLAVNTSGLISLYFLGADFINTDLKGGIAGYIVGPVFELPFVCLSSQMQDGVCKAFQQRLNPNWSKLKKPLLSLKGLGDGTYWVVLGALGGLLAINPVYYTEQYLRPLIGPAVWVFTFPTFISNGVTASVATHYFLTFVRKNLGDYFFKSCKSDATCYRERLSKWIGSWIEKLETEEASGITQRCEECAEMIRDGNFTEVLKTARADAVENGTEVNEVSRGYKWAQLGTGVAGAVVGFVGAYSGLKAIQKGCSFVLSSWFGVNPETADTVGNVTGYVGGGVYGCVRSYFNSKTFQRIHGLLYSCSKKKKTCSLKTGTLEGLNWVLAGMTVTPIVKVLTDNVQTGALQTLLLIESIISTVCGDYFAWQHVPEAGRDLLLPPKPNRTAIEVLQKFQSDLEKMSDEAILALFESVSESYELVNN